VGGHAPKETARAEWLRAEDGFLWTGRRQPVPLSTSNRRSGGGERRKVLQTTEAQPSEGFLGF